MKPVLTTKDKRGKEALKKSEERAQLIFENMRDHAWLMDMNFKTTWASPSTVRTRGFKPEELPGATLDRHMTPASVTRLTELIAKQLSPDNLADKRKEVVIEGEFEFYRKDGTAFWGDTVATLLRKRDGAPVGFLFVVRDVTGRKQGEEALREKEAKLGTLFEILPVGVAILDKEHRISFINPALEKILEISREGLFRGDYKSRKYLRSDRTLMPPEEFASARAIKEQRAVHDIVTGVVKENGAVIWTSVSAIPVTFSDWKVVIVTADITERTWAGEEANRQKEIMQRVFDNIPVMITYFDETGTIKMVNREIIKKLGWSFEEWQTEDVLAKSYPDPKALKEVLDFMGNKPTGWKDFKTTTKSGTVIDTTFTNVFLSDGFSMGIGQDITERKRAEATIQASELRYRQLVENASEAILVAQDGFHKFVNQRAVEMTGYSEPELLSRPFFEFIHPDDREMVMDTHRKRITGETAQSRYVFRYLNREGGFKWVETGSVLIDWEGRPATLNFLTDVTDRLKAEEVIQASLREKEVMLQEIHHRVKNNMQVISSLFNLQAGKTVNAEFRDSMKQGQARIRAMSLVHEKLYRSRNLSKIDLAGYIQSLAAHLFNVYLTDSNRIRLETDLEEVPLDINSAVPCGLILNELISNSLKHAFPEGRKGLIRIGLKRGPDNLIILRVADDGIGFPKDIDFLQSESVGLQISNLLVGQLDATIELDRENGTAFTVTFRELKYAPRS